jgi:hypothetical protein
MTSPTGDTGGTTINDLVMVTFIYDPALGSPAEYAQYANINVAVPKDVIPLPARGKLLGLGGYSRQAGGAWQWVLQGDTDPVDQFVNNLTGKGGWTNPTSKAAIVLLVQRLFSAGIPRSTIAAQVPQMYNAVAAEVLAEQAQGIL